jgi:hypothetical protein
MKRYGFVIRIQPEAIERYKTYHHEVWPEILEMIRSCNIRNYSRRGGCAAGAQTGRLVTSRSHLIVFRGSARTP